VAFRDHPGALVADRNLTIAEFLLQNRPGPLEAPAYERVIIVSFYSTVRCIDAWIQSFQDRPPVNHGERFRAILKDRSSTPGDPGALLAAPELV
jgi:hypothetical protein